jgi:hypothetical protein
MGLKPSDLNVMPLCGPRSMEPGCHWLLGTSGKIPKHERRELESQYVQQTQLDLILMSQDDPKIRKVLAKVGLVK